MHHLRRAVLSQEANNTAVSDRQAPAAELRTGRDRSILPVPGRSSAEPPLVCHDTRAPSRGWRPVVILAIDQGTTGTTKCVVFVRLSAKLVRTVRESKLARSGLASGFSRVASRPKDPHCSRQPKSPVSDICSSSLLHNATAAVLIATELAPRRSVSTTPGASQARSEPHPR